MTHVASRTVPRPLDRAVVRVAAAMGLSIVAITAAVSPKGAALAIAFLAPVFVPALVGAVLGIAPGGSRTRCVIAGALMVPGFALATFLAAHYSPDSSDTPARGGAAAATAIDVLGPLGAVTAMTAVAMAALRRPQQRRPINWAPAIAVGNLLVLVTALSVNRPG